LSTDVLREPRRLHPGIGLIEKWLLWNFVVRMNSAHETEFQ